MTLASVPGVRRCLGLAGAVLLGFGFGGTVAVAAPSEEEVELIEVPQGPPQVPEYAPRLEKLRQLLARGAASEWDGEYSWGTGYESARLSFVQGTGYAYESSSCVTGYRSVGDIFPDGAGFAVRRQSGSTPASIEEKSQLVPIRWGERRYLVPDDQLGDFAFDVAYGREPRCGPQGRFFLRKGGEAIVVSGPPELPAAWQGLLHADPIDLRVTDFDVETIYQSGVNGRSRRMNHRVRLDGGTDRGVMVGMRLMPARGEPFHAMARITAVQAHSAEAELETMAYENVDEVAKPPLHGGTYPLRAEVTGPYPGAALTVRAMPADIDAPHCRPALVRQP
jgi:hypothetical protein